MLTLKMTFTTLGLSILYFVSIYLLLDWGALFMSKWMVTRPIKKSIARAKVAHKSKSSKPKRIVHKKASGKKKR